MAIYVDALVNWGTVPEDAQARRHFGGGKPSCHLVTDGARDELHAFAARLGMRRAWFQDARSLPHYDLTPSRRARALQLGATEINRRQLVEIMRAGREQRPAEVARYRDGAASETPHE